MKLVVVTGSRRWANKRELFDALADQQPSVVIHGGANGADSLAGAWANDNGVMCIVVPALWASHGPSAGSKRNDRMLNLATTLATAKKLELVVLAFPTRDSIGTRDCMRRAERLGLTVVNRGVK